MDRIITITDEQNRQTDRLLNMFVHRYLKEKGRWLSERETNLCWCCICGIVIRDGYEAGQEYVKTVQLG